MTLIKWTLPLFLFIFLSCRPTKSTSSKKEKANIACAGSEIKGPHFDWKIEREDILKSYTERPLPKGYKVYTIDSEQLIYFFTYAQKHLEDTSLKISVPLPAPLGCRIFDLPSFKTKPVPKNATELIVMSGQDEEMKDNTIRVNYDWKRLLVNVLWDGSYYTVLPVTHNDKTYYILYLRTDIGLKKDALKQQTSPKPLTPLFDR